MRLLRRMTVYSALIAWSALVMAFSNAASGVADSPDTSQFPVKIRVDASKQTGELRPVWRFFGYDEPNYTYMKDGKKLLAELSSLGPKPVFVRTHNLLTSGDGTPALKWGSTGVYSEDAQGKPVYNWAIVDRIFDTLHERGMKPLVEIGFMPEALSTKPQPYQHHWKPGDQYATIVAGWAYPPTDYGKWAELVYQWVRHSVERYGRGEVESWYWELWNEPDISYWQGTPEEYFKLYDYTAGAVKRALPAARIGGPHSTGPGGNSARFLRAFLEHCIRGKNNLTAGTGAPLDFIGFHAKGAPKFIDGHVQTGIDNQLRALDRGFEIVASFPELKTTPIIIGESDPDGCAACPSSLYPQNGYRNGTLFASYTAAAMTRHQELAERRGVNLVGAVTWAFEFEDQPYFAGFRALSTNGIALPVLNVFRMLGRLGGRRVLLESDGAVSLDVMLKDGARLKPDVAGVASLDGKKLSILIWHHHDNDVPGPEADVEIAIAGIPIRSGEARLAHFRVDERLSNSFAEWKRMGSPVKPTPQQYNQLANAGRLAAIGGPQQIRIKNGGATLRFSLPRQAVSLLVLELK
ncbi:MAG TPA: beta-xylosidase [Blastocatellia bacterium]|nr:beta-xylosidase [Blastocatellia bacterium]